MQFLKNLYSKCKEVGTKVLATAGLIGVSASASAAVPVEVTTAITDAGADAVTIAAAMLVAIIGLIGFKLMRRAAK